jgi:hypothetical protein
MIYARSKASDLQFAPFTDAQGTSHENSVNLFEWTYDAHPCWRRPKTEPLVRVVPTQN